MTRKFILYVCFLICIQFVYAQQKLKNEFILQGTMLNRQDGLVYLSYQNMEGKYFRDSAFIKNGKFGFKGMISEPTMAYFTTNAQVRGMDDPNYTSFYLEPAVMKIVVRENEFKEAKISGSKTQREYEDLQLKSGKLRKRWKVVMDTLSEVNKRSNAEYQELKNWVLKPYIEEMKEINWNFLRSHPNSYVSPMVLFSVAGDLTSDSLIMYYNRFPEKVKQTAYGKIIREELERRKIGVPGTIAANFTATDINGNKLTLADYKGKYVLIDFWASWCVPCRKGNPHLLAVYSKYKEKGFEIIGISDDDRNHEAWRKAVDQDKIGVWKHVLRGLDMDKKLKGQKNPNDISEGYGIATLPTKILIDANGNIIGRYGESKEDVDAMDKKLEEIFNR